MDGVGIVKESKRACQEGIPTANRLPSRGSANGFSTIRTVIIQLFTLSHGISLRRIRFRRLTLRFSYDYGFDPLSRAILVRLDSIHCGRPAIPDSLSRVRRVGL